MLWGGLRIGWIRTAAPMVRRIGALRAATDLGGPVLEQLLATRLIDDLDPSRCGPVAPSWLAAATCSAGSATPSPAGFRRVRRAG